MLRRDKATSGELISPATMPCPEPRGDGMKRRSKAAGKAVIHRRLQLRSRSNAAIIMAAAVAP